MSKHLLYRNDLLNRTLTRSLLFVLAQLVACLIILFQAIPPVEAAGPLSVKKTSPSYFFDSKGNPVYLTGSYLNEYNLLSGSSDFVSYLDSLQQQNQNFTRVWGWEQSPWIYDNSGQISFSTQPYERTGPGLALDGGLKFDLTRLNQVYFDQLRSRVVEAAQRGIYVSVALFEGFSTQKKMGRVNPWLGDPFQQANNINGINGDPNQNGGSEEFFSLAFPSLVSLQEAFTRKVVDTLNDLDNVLYEVNGNGLAGSLSWQYHMIDYIRRYQKKTANQYPVGISDFYAGSTAEVLNSSADWIVIQETNLNPPPDTLKKILIVEASPSVSGSQIFSNSAIALVQVLPDSVSIQSSSISNKTSSEGVTLLSSSATSSALATTQSSSNKNQQSQVATPTITPNGGVYSSTVAVTLQTTTPGASIYYTTDGQSPTQSSSPYTGKFKLSGSTLVKAKAFKNNFDPSSEASAWFANASSPTVAPSGLVGYWKFDEGSGTTVADASGNGNTGTLVNGPLWSAGRVGNGLYFDGIDDNVTVPDSPSLHLSSSFTLSAWVNPTVAQSNFTTAIAKNTASSDVYYLYATSGNGYCGATGFPLAGASIAGVHQIICNSSGLALNTWSHLTATYDGSNFKFYVNGSLAQTVPSNGTIDPTSGTLQIGASYFGEYFKGFIDEVRIYNRALSDTEIQTIYQQDSGTPVQTVATPIISPNGGNYSGSVSVTMQTATSGASIYYTTNGSTPTQSSTLYTGTMTLTSSATVKAKAFKSGYTASAEASAAFTVSQPFNFSLANSGDLSVVAGSSVTNSINTTLASGSAQAVTFSASGLPSGATASFSSTSCSPSCSSTLTINTTGSTPAGTSNITVTATGAGVTKTTTFNLAVGLPAVAMPAISPNGGSFTNTVSVTMQTATSGASIYYTTNGSSPTQSSTLYTGAINLTSSAAVKAKAFKSGSNASAEASASFTVSSAVAPSGLVAYWKFDEGTGTTVADSSGNGNTATLVNGPLWSAGRVGNGLYFDGIDDNVTVPDSPSLHLSSSFTLSAWVNPTVAQSNFTTAIAKNTASSDVYYLYATSGNGYCGATGFPLAGASIAGVHQVICNSSGLPLNTWSHLTATYDGSNFKFYVNGSLAQTVPSNGTIDPTSGTLQIGASYFGEYFKGFIDEVRIYNRALSDTEIQTIYQQDSALAASQPFGFSLANSGDISVIAGSSVTNSISTGLTSGSAQPVTFSVSGLPSGATGSFSSISCNPGCSIILNVNTTGSTPAGNFPITISATGGGVTRTTAFALSVTLAVTTSTGTSTGTGKVYYVAKTGSNANSCTQAQNQRTPKLTIAAGISCLTAAGDTLNITAGTYPETIDGQGIPSGTSYSNPVTIQAYGSDVVTLTGAGITIGSDGLTHQYIVFRNLILDGVNLGPGSHGGMVQLGGGANGGSIDHIKIDGIEIKNVPSKTHGMQLGGGDASAHDLWITNTKVHDGGSDPDPYLFHVMYITGSNIIVENSELYNWTKGYAIHHYNSPGFQPAPSNNIYRYNYIHNTGQNAPQTVWAIILGAGSNNKVYGNLVINNMDGIDISSDNNVVYNNTVYGNGIGFSYPCCYEAIRLDSGAGNVVKNNILFNNAINNIVNNGTNNIISTNLTLDPLFIDAANSNFHLGQYSPAIDAGTSNIAPGITLIFNGSAPDMGALEY